MGWRDAWAILFVGAIGTSLAVRAAATDYYISTTGNDANAGSDAAPFATLTKAISVVKAGETIYVHGGTYNLSGAVSIASSKVGTAASPYRVFAVADEAPILRGSGGRGIELRGQYWHLKGLTVEDSADYGVYVTGSNNIVENFTVRRSGNIGVHISGSTSVHPANNLIVNTDSYENYDPGGHGEDGDGFGSKANIGTGNTFRGDRAWGNSDDGWDFWNAPNGVVVENCWSFGNGVNIWGDTAFQGDGNAYKLGENSGPHLLNNVLAWNNVQNGIDVNGNVTAVKIYNSTSYHNGGFNFQWDESFATQILRNNISLQGGEGVDGVQVYPGVTQDHNSWNAGFSVAATDFLSLDDAIARGPRNSDGSLRVSNFLKLAPGSPLIDAGVNVGLPFKGTAPDLGAFETSPTPPPVLPGDFNSDNVVDAADYIVWRNGYPTVYSLTDYDAWRSHFGQTSGPGATAGLSSGVAVPEAATVVLTTLLFAFLAVPSRFLFNRGQ